MHSQIAGKSTPRYVSSVGTLLGSSSLPTQCRKHRLGQGLTGLGGSVAFQAGFDLATCGGGLGNHPIWRTTFVSIRPIGPALDSIRSLFASVP